LITFPQRVNPYTASRSKVTTILFILLFKIYHKKRQFLFFIRMGKNTKLTTNQSIVAGSVAGLVSGFSFQPLEVLRTRAIG
jgi:hypothetical protein